MKGGGPIARSPNRTPPLRVLRLHPRQRREVQGAAVVRLLRSGRLRSGTGVPAPLPLGHPSDRPGPFSRALQCQDDRTHRADGYLGTSDTFSDRRSSMV